jgi:hypothetical protein
MGKHEHGIRTIRYRNVVFWLAPHAAVAQTKANVLSQGEGILRLWQAEEPHASYRLCKLSQNSAVVPKK